MGYLSNNRIDTLLDIPVSLPLTAVAPGDWVIISSFKIPASKPTVKATLRVLQLFLVTDTGADTVGVALQKDFVANSNPTSGAVELLQITGPAPKYASRNPLVPLVLDGNVAGSDGIYSFVVYNLSSSNSAILSVTGSVRLDVSPSA